MNDINTTQITAGLAGTITAGALILYILQNVKALIPSLQGRNAEAAGGLASLAAVLVAFTLADADWMQPTVYAELFVAWMSAWVSARAGYAMLFKVSVSGVPPSSEAEATDVHDPVYTETSV